MLHRKTNPVGIDKTIDRLQTKVYDLLGWNNYESFHRVYVNETEGGLVPERYKQDRDYSEVFFDDRYDATSYLIINSPVNQGDLPEYTVDYYFQVKLEKLYPTVPHRADEECHEEVLKALIKATSGRRQIDSLVFGIGNVYRGFDRSQIKWTDTGSFHCFKYTLTLVKESSCKG